MVSIELSCRFEIKFTIIWQRKGALVLTVDHEVVSIF